MPNEDKMPDAQEPQPRLLPARIRLLAPHGFIDENERHRFWHAGDVVSDPAEVALLLDRGAPVEEVLG